MELMKEQSIVIGQVEDFIKRIHDGDKVITPEAQKTILTMAVGGEDTFGRPKKEPHSLAILLGSAMSCYQSVKDITVS